jgi:hypothetical protein
MSFEFGEVLTRAWQITQKHKVLWIFGILAGCSRAGGSGGGGGGGSGYSSRGGENPDLPRFMDNFGRWIGEHWWVVVLVILALFLLILLGIVLSTIGRIGLIKGTLDVEGGAQGLAWGPLFQASLPYFWRVFGLSFLIGLAFMIVYIPLLLFGVLTAGVGFLCVLPLICILVPVAIVVSVILEQANVAIVAGNLGMLAGLRRGWEIVRANPGPVAVMAIILYVIGLAIGLAIALPIIAVVFPTALIFAVNASNQANPSFLPMIIAGLCILAYLPVALLANGVLMTYTGSAWTLTYLRLAKPKEEPAVIQPTNA